MDKGRISLRTKVTGRLGGLPLPHPVSQARWITFEFGGFFFQITFEYENVKNHKTPVKSKLSHTGQRGYAENMQLMILDTQKVMCL